MKNKNGIPRIPVCIEDARDELAGALKECFAAIERLGSAAGLGTLNHHIRAAVLGLGGTGTEGKDSIEWMPADDALADKLEDCRFAVRLFSEGGAEMRQVISLPGHHVRADELEDGRWRIYMGADEDKTDEADTAKDAMDIMHFYAIGERDGE